MLAITPPAPEGLVFQPDRFFLSETTGRGVVRDFSGRLIDRCRIDTVGRWDHQSGAMHFDEIFAYDSGRIDTLNWAFAPDAQGRMTATEISVTSPVRGWREGGDYRLRFRRAGAPPLSGVKLTFDTRFSPMEPDLVLKFVRVKLFGVPMGTMTAFHRQVSGSPRA
jgi:hypothetical protein